MCFSSPASALHSLNGGHDAEGNEKENLSFSRLKDFLKDSKIESIAIASQFSTRNPEHENKIRDYVRKNSSLPITCSHELSYELDGPKRAVTCVLNASLTHIIAVSYTHLRAHET